MRTIPSRRLASVSIALASLLATAPSLAQSKGAAAGRRGTALAKKGDCVAALPLLEEAELERHRPAVASVLAECYVQTGKLIEAADVLHALEAEAQGPTPRGWDWSDKKALQRAAARAREIDARIPVILFIAQEEYPELEITIGGRAVEDLEAGRRVPPDQSLDLEIAAKGYVTKIDKVVLAEGEKRRYRFRLEPEAAKVVPKPKPKIAPYWVGIRWDGYVVPQPWMNVLWDGGTTTAFPGGGLTFTARTPAADVTLGLGYLGFFLPDTAILPRGAPQTDWEIVSLQGHAITLGLDVMFRFPLDKEERGAFRFGFGLGGGLFVDGALRRTQAYPGDQGGTTTLVKCLGPNNPAGSFSYCNELDKDKDHYGEFKEPSIFEGGSFPQIFPLVSFPMLGFSYRFSPGVTGDLDAALSLGGIRTTLGLRFGL